MVIERRFDPSSEAMMQRADKASEMKSIIHRYSSTFTLSLVSARQFVFGKLESSYLLCNEPVNVQVELESNREIPIRERRPFEWPGQASPTQEIQEMYHNVSFANPSRSLCAVSTCHPRSSAHCRHRLPPVFNDHPMVS